MPEQSASSPTTGVVTLDSLAIPVSAVENRAVSFTNKRSAYYYTQTHRNDHPEHAYFRGFNIAGRRIFSDYRLTVDGKARTITVRPDSPTWMTLTPAQLASASLKPGSGQVIVTSDWEGPLDPSSLHRDGVTTFGREVTPSGPVPIDGVVTVRYTVELNADADAGCWLVTDLVPSGLAPIGMGSSWWSEDEEEASAAQDEAPWRVDGQRADFCVQRDPKHPVVTLRYIARVVSPGTYRWEPAVIQSSIVREHGAVVPATTAVIADER
jgi:uncharacterized protein YfaS (alpha-2-macroglobulin family)